MSYQHKGKLITIEGIEGAGKSTVIDFIQTRLAQKNIKTITTREPGGTVIGEKIREIFKSKQSNEYFSPYTELFLLYASRVQLLENVIKPALMQSTWIVSDRFELSSFAYQGAGRGIEQAFINKISEQVMQSIQPNLIIYLDIDPELGLTRVKMRGELDRVEQEQLAFFNRVREGYLAFAKQNTNIIVIDAAMPIEQVKQQIETELVHRFPELA